MVDEKKSFILIITLWVVILISIFMVILGYNIRRKIDVIKHLENNDKINYLFDFAFRKALLEIENKKDSFVLLTEPSKIYNEPEIFFADSSKVNRYLCRFDNIEIFYGIFDEERKININKASLSILKRLFKFIGLDDMTAQEISASIIDWRDEDSFLTIPLKSAESPYYRSLDTPYEAKDFPIEVLEELLLVKGITPEIFEKIERYITIYGDGAININTASKEIFLILGLDEDVSNKIIIFRSGKDGVLGTDDDNFFESPDSIVPKLVNFYKIKESSLNSLINLIEIGLIKTNSDYFSIIVVSNLNNNFFKKLKTIVNRKGEVLYWNEN